MACSSCLKTRRDFIGAVQSVNIPGTIEAIKAAAAINRDKLRMQFMRHAKAARRNRGKAT